eukprot:1161939-Pelagomonas_calceolata.AAC.6
MVSTAPTSSCTASTSLPPAALGRATSRHGQHNAHQQLHRKYITATCSIRQGHKQTWSAQCPPAAALPAHLCHPQQELWTGKSSAHCRGPDTGELKSVLRHKHIAAPSNFTCA